MDDFDLGSLEVTNGGLDSFLGGNPEVVTPVRASASKLINEDRKPSKRASGRTKVASLDQLNGFVRTGEDMLIHKSDRDLWALRQDGGDFYIERMFDDMGAPLKG